MLRSLLRKAAPFVATLVASAFIGQAVQTPQQASNVQPTQQVEPTQYPTQIPPTPRPTYTPVPTPTAYPTATPYPTANPAIQRMQLQDPSGVGGTSTNAEPNAASGYTCNCAKTCPSMSCQEAYFQLNQCGCSARDGDGDGVPCEAQCR